MPGIFLNARDTIVSWTNQCTHWCVNGWAKYGTYIYDVVLFSFKKEEDSVWISHEDITNK